MQIHLAVHVGCNISSCTSFSFLKTENAESIITTSLFDTGNELIKLAASFQSSQGRPVTKLLSVAKRVRNAFRKTDKPQFVSAFCQSNCGDVSPNVLGAFCTDTGLACDFNQSTCNGKNELCYGRGPGYIL